MNVRGVLGARARLLGRELWRNGRPRRGLVPLALTGLVAAGFTYTFAGAFGALARSGASRAAATPMLAWGFTLAAVLLALGDLHLVITATVTARDLDRLRAAPIGPGGLLGVKLAEMAPRTFSGAVSVALPAALAFAGAFGDVEPPRLAAALFTLWAVPLGLGLVAALPILHVAPAARVRESVATLATFAFVAGWLANVFWLPRLAGRMDVAAPLHLLPMPPAWSPGAWAATMLTARGPLAVAAAIGGVAAGALALAAAVAAARALLARVQDRAAAPAGMLVRGSVRRERTLAAAFLRRDAALLRRDWTVALDAAANLALWSLLPLAVLPVAPLPRQELARAMLIALSASLGYDLAARALPLERRALAWARLSPLGGASWLRLRALGLGLLGGGVATFAALLTSAALRLGLPGVLDAWAFALAAATTAMATGLFLGATLGDLDWTDPRTMLGLGGRSVAAFVLLAQGAGWLALAHRLSPRAPLGAGPLGLLLAAGALAGAAILWVTARALERREFPET